MSSVNKVILIGNLGKDPETRYTTGGDAVANVSIATTESWTDKASGEKREATEWHRVVFYRRLAEIVGEYLKKGAKVYIEGRIKTQKWQDKNTGEDRYSTIIEATEMKMLGSRDQAQGSDNADQSAPQETQRQRAPLTNHTVADLDDDIPF